MAKCFSALGCIRATINNIELYSARFIIISPHPSSKHVCLKKLLHTHRVFFSEAITRNPRWSNSKFPAKQTALHANTT